MAGALPALLALTMLVGSSGCETVFGQRRPVEKEAYGIMDTDVTIKAYGRNASVAIDKAIDEMRRLHRMLSAYDEDSEVSLINGQAGLEPVKVSPAVFQIVERSLYFASISEGAFDPTVFPIMKLWGFGEPEPRVPAARDIEALLGLVDYRKVVLDKEASTVFLEEKGMAIDLGAIAKGFAVDVMAETMRKEGITSFLINAGGNVYASGRKPEKTPWTVAVTDPRDPQEFMGIMKATDISIVSSGDYQRFFEEAGQRYHHIIDPETGYPAGRSKGTTVFLESSRDADGLSTALFVLGPERSAQVLDKFPGVGAIFVLPDGKIRTMGIVDNFEFK